jgi:ankyrin repeat protein
MNNLASLQIVNQMPRKQSKSKLDALDMADTNDERLLHAAITIGQAKNVSYLLDKGLSPDVLVEGEPAICVAARLGHCAILEMLVMHGAKVAVFDSNRQTPLSYSINNQCT